MIFFKKLEDVSLGFLVFICTIQKNVVPLQGIIYNY